MEYKRRWQDGVGLLLGSWLFCAPFFGIGPVIGLSAWDGYLFGALILIFSALSLAQPWLREERIGMFIGLWLIAAPFVLGFPAHDAASFSHIVIGLLIVADVLMAPKPAGNVRRI